MSLTYRLCAAKSAQITHTKARRAHKDLPKAKTPHEQESIQRQLAATDRQIDMLVYELYGLTDDEIRIVEGA